MIYHDHHDGLIGLKKVRGCSGLRHLTPSRGQLSNRIREMDKGRVESTKLRESFMYVPYVHTLQHIHSTTKVVVVPFDVVPCSRLGVWRKMVLESELRARIIIVATCLRADLTAKSVYEP